MVLINHGTRSLCPDPRRRQARDKQASRGRADFSRAVSVRCYRQQHPVVVLLERQGGLGPALSRASGFFWSWTPDVCMSVNLVIDRCTATRAAIRTPALLIS